MLFYLQTINLAYALGGLALLLATFVLAYDYWCNQSRWYEKFVSKYVWYLLMLVTWGGLATTLLYSEVFGFVPCSLCWLQRVALYPQALMSIMAWRVKDGAMMPLYGIGLSIFGFLVAVYQYIYQLIPAETRETLMPCLVDGTADCGTKVMEVFGFVTFPFLSAATFAFLIVIYLNLRRVSKSV
jgi:disulfide bond formation protein DsbB